MLRLTRSSCNVLAVVAVLAMMPAGAQHCFGYVSSPEVDLTYYGLGYYVDNDLCQPECAASVWVYAESNGIAGLQRDDPIFDDTCHGLVAGDTIVLGVLDADLYGEALP